MDLSQFYRDDHANEYEVEVEVQATLRETVTADSPEAAKAVIAARLERNDVDIYGEDIEASRVVAVRKTPPMFCIRRPGSPTITGTTHPQLGDEPREPTAREPNAYKPGAAS